MLFFKTGNVPVCSWSVSTCHVWACGGPRPPLFHLLWFQRSKDRGLFSRIMAWFKLRLGVKAVPSVAWDAGSKVGAVSCEFTSFPPQFAITYRSEVRMCREPRLCSGTAHRYPVSWGDLLTCFFCFRSGSQPRPMQATDLRVGAHSVSFLRTIGLLPAPASPGPARKHRGRLRGVSSVKLQEKALSYFAFCLPNQSVLWFIQFSEVQQTQAFLGDEILALLPPLTPQAGIFLFFFPLFPRLFSWPGCEPLLLWAAATREPRQWHGLAKALPGNLAGPTQTCGSLRWWAGAMWSRQPSLCSYARARTAAKRSQHIIHLQFFQFCIGTPVLRVRISWPLLQWLRTIAPVSLQQSHSLVPPYNSLALRFNPLAYFGDWLNLSDL